MSTGGIKKFPFATRLRSLMEEQGLRKIDVAKKIGVSHPIVANWLESRVIPGGENLLALAKFFHCSVDYLLGLSETKLTIQGYSGPGNQILPDDHFQGYPDGEFKGASLDDATLHSGKTIFPGDIERSCLDYFQQFLKSCDRDPIKLGWIMTELKTHFPLNKWEKEIQWEREIKWKQEVGKQVNEVIDS